MITEYWKTKLNREGQINYNSILRAIQQGQKIIDLPHIDAGIISNVYSSICDDHPELFYLSHKSIITQHSLLIGFINTRYQCKLELEKIYSDKQIQKHQETINNTISHLKSLLKPSSSAKEKIILVADYIVSHTKYEINNAYNQNAASVFCEGKAQCSGIAKAFKLAMDCLNIYCLIVNGEAEDSMGKRGSHSWNIVYINNHYYHIDVTYMLGANLDGNLPIIKTYLFYNDKKMMLDHTWEVNLIPRCDSDKMVIDDLKTNTNNSMKATACSSITPTHNKQLTYKSIEEVCLAVKTAVRNKDSNLFFYYNDKRLCKQNELLNNIELACKRTLNRENITCKYSVIVYPDLLVHIELTY